jgi:hypothetical protein
MAGPSGPERSRRIRRSINLRILAKRVITRESKPPLYWYDGFVRMPFSGVAFRGEVLALGAGERPNFGAVRSRRGSTRCETRITSEDEIDIEARSD